LLLRTKEEKGSHQVNRVQRGPALGAPTQRYNESQRGRGNRINK
jgi:hypothetical protein